MSNLFFPFGKSPHQTLDMVTKPAAKHQRSDKSLSIKLSKNSKMALPTRMLPHFSMSSRISSPIGKKNRKIFQSNESGLKAKRVKSKNMRHLTRHEKDPPPSPAVVFRKIYLLKRGSNPGFLWLLILS